MTITQLIGINKTTRNRLSRHLSRSFEIVAAVVLWFVVYPVMPVGVPFETALVLIIGMFLMLEGLFKWLRYFDRHTRR